MDTEKGVNRVKPPADCALELRRTPSAWLLSRCIVQICCTIKDQVTSMFKHLTTQTEHLVKRSER